MLPRSTTSSRWIEAKAGSSASGASTSSPTCSNHQVHHRGQAHAMLAGTAVKPPQLDEFLMPSEAHLRHADVAALGWTEASLFRGAHG
jgi:hypothetical protein